MRIIRVEKGNEYDMPLLRGGWSAVTASKSGILVLLDAVEVGAGGVFIPDSELAKALPQLNAPVYVPKPVRNRRAKNGSSKT